MMDGNSMKKSKLNVWRTVVVEIFRLKHGWQETRLHKYFTQFSRYILQAKRTDDEGAIFTKKSS